MRSEVSPVKDYEGMELCDLRTARSYALAEARDVIKRDRSGDGDWSLWTFEITDEKGAYALTVPFADAEKFSDAENGNGTNGGASAAFRSWPTRR